MNLSGSGSELGTSVIIAKTDVVQFVDSSFVFPKEKSVIDKEVKNADVKLWYSCIDGKCDFTSAIKTITESNELKGLGVKQLSEIIVQTIDQNPDIFPSSTAGGYVLQSTGRSFLLLENKTEGVKDQSPRYGFVDLTEVRKKLIFESMRQKELNRYKDFNQKGQNWSDIALNGLSGIGVAASVGAVVFILRKVA